MASGATRIVIYIMRRTGSRVTTRVPVGVSTRSQHQLVLSQRKDHNMRQLLRLARQLQSRRSGCASASFVTGQEYMHSRQIHTGQLAQMHDRWRDAKAGSTHSNRKAQAGSQAGYKQADSNHSAGCLVRSTHTRTHIVAQSLCEGWQRTLCRRELQAQTILSNFHTCDRRCSLTAACVIVAEKRLKLVLKHRCGKMAAGLDMQTPQHATAHVLFLTVVIVSFSSYCAWHPVET